MHGWQIHNGLLREIRMFVICLESFEVIMIAGKLIPQNIPGLAQYWFGYFKILMLLLGGEFLVCIQLQFATISDE